MRISVLVSDPMHPVADHVRRWAADLAGRGHAVEVNHDQSEPSGGDILFLVSCTRIITEAIRRKYRATLVLHASDLPRGRGWSPHIWSILGGSNRVDVSLLEAADRVDSGRVWLRSSFELEGHELLPEINEKLFARELELMTQAVERSDAITPVEQEGDTGPYLRKRTPEDSRLDPDKTIAEQFDQLRVADERRFPAFFEYRGKRYAVSVRKVPDGE